MGIGRIATRVHTGEPQWEMSTRTPRLGKIVNGNATFYRVSSICLQRKELEIQIGKEEKMISILSLHLLFGHLLFFNGMSLFNAFDLSPFSNPSQPARLAGSSCFSFHNSSVWLLNVGLVVKLLLLFNCQCLLQCLFVYQW